MALKVTFVLLLLLEGDTDLEYGQVMVSRMILPLSTKLYPMADGVEQSVVLALSIQHLYISQQGNILSARPLSNITIRSSTEMYVLPIAPMMDLADSGYSHLTTQLF